MSARAAAAAAALLVIVTSCTGSPVATKHRQEQPSPTAPKKNGLQIAAERHTIAERILRARSRAVREHDEKAWLAPVDPSNTALVQRERRLFANLSRLPLQVFTLHANKEWTWPDGFAQDRYAATAYLPYVEQRMRLRGFDSEPVTAVYSYTFAEVDGRWRIVADDDVTDQAGQSNGTLPWDVAAIRVHRTRHALGIFDAGSDGEAGRLMAAAESSVHRVRAAVPGRWPGRVVFYALSDDGLLEGMGEKYLDAAAVAFPVPDNSMWWDHVAGTRVMINPAALPRSSGEAVYLLSHEVTHVALAREGETTPTWLQEGLAEYVATGGADGPGWQPAPSAVEKASEGVTAMPGSTFFGDEDPAFDYALSLAACTVIARTYGEDRLWDFLDRTAKAGRDGDREAHTDPVLRRMFGIGEKTLARKAAALIVAAYA